MNEHLVEVVTAILTEEGPERYRCPKCERVLEIEDMDVLGFADCGCPDCGVEISEMKRCVT
ncbi:MAG TPA: hypothetical protein VMW24_15870 [Sedimentisphaerales bacterium]|nr:hypothetical protein [Sedimentisphaerales bacterium]